MQPAITKRSKSRDWQGIATPPHHDVTVVGGGPAGAAAAVRLLQLGRSVVLLERSGYDKPRPGEHLSPAARPLLSELTGDDSTLTGPHERSTGITMSWGDDTVRHTDYLFDPYSFGHHLDRCRFDRDLADVVPRLGGTLRLRTRVRSVRRGSDRSWIVTAADGSRVTELTASFLVDATGRSAAVGRMLGSARRRVDRLVGVCAHVPLDAASGLLRSRLLLESSETGWWYATAPHADRGVVVFMTDADLIRDGCTPTGQLWRQRLDRTRLIRSALPELEGTVRLEVRPADSSILEPMHGPSWVAVGEAAEACDPLSARGIVRALQSGLAAGTAIDRALDGDTEPLGTFASDRRAQFHQYLDERLQVYRQERRWVSKEFWARRTARG